MNGSAFNDFSENQNKRSAFYDVDDVRIRDHEIIPSSPLNKSNESPVRGIFVWGKIQKTCFQEFCCK